MVGLVHGMHMRFISQHAILAYLGNAKALAFLVAAYVLSPIDLIPDFIPILGYGDDLIVVALGALAVAQLVPPDIMGEDRATAERVLEAR